MSGMAFHRGARALAAAAMLLAFQCSATAQVDRAVAEDLMHKSGTWEQLGSIAPQALAGFKAAAAQARSPAPADEQERVAKVIGAAYAPALLRSVAASVIAQGLKPEDAAVVADWYRSTLGDAIARLEEASSASPEAPEVRLHAGMDVFAKASPERQALLKRLVQVTHAAEGQTQLVIDSTVAIQQGLAAAQPSLPAPATSEVRAAFEKQRPKMQQGFAGLSAALFAGTYAKISNEELAEYIAFLSEGAGAHYAELDLQALSQAMRAAGLELGRAMPGTKARANP
jgi:hypothetical protein